MNISYILGWYKIKGHDLNSMQTSSFTCPKPICFQAWRILYFIWLCEQNSYFFSWEWGKVRYHSPKTSPYLILNDVHGLDVVGMYI